MTLNGQLSSCNLIYNLPPSPDSPFKAALVTFSPSSQVFSSPKFSSSHLLHNFISYCFERLAAARVGGQFWCFLRIIPRSNYTLWSFLHTFVIAPFIFIPILPFWWFPMAPESYQKLKSSQRGRIIWGARARSDRHSRIRMRCNQFQEVPRALFCFHLKRRAVERRLPHCEAQRPSTQGSSIQNTKGDNMKMKGYL